MKVIATGKGSLLDAREQMELAHGASPSLPACEEDDRGRTW